MLTFKYKSRKTEASMHSTKCNSSISPNNTTDTPYRQSSIKMLDLMTRLAWIELILKFKASATVFQN